MLRVILPETCAAYIDQLEKVIAAEAEQGFERSAIRRLAALLPSSPDVAEASAARLRLSKAQRARLMRAAERKASDVSNPKALAYSIGIEFASFYKTMGAEVTVVEPELTIDKTGPVAIDPGDTGNFTIVGENPGAAAGRGAEDRVFMASAPRGDEGIRGV